MPKTTSSDASGELDFPMPDGFQPPEGAAPGETFDQVATFSWGADDDTLTLTAIGGVPIPASSAAEEDDAEAAAPAPTNSNSSFKDAMMSSLAAGGKPPM